MMEQALTTRMKEEAIPVPAAPGAAPGATSAKVEINDPKLAAALKKSQSGQTLSPDEQEMVASAALMKAESRLRNAYRMLKESEVQQAQVVLAAQDMVDKMQGMLEDVSELQFKELPALVDSIKNQVGVDQATQFNGDASAALSGLMQNLQQAKQQLDQALGVVTGTASPAMDPAMGGAPAMDPAMDPAMGGAPAMDPAMDPAMAAEPEMDAEPVGGAGLGRARR